VPTHKYKHLNYQILTGYELDVPIPKAIFISLKNSELQNPALNHGRIRTLEALYGASWTSVEILSIQRLTLPKAE
jgi:hypothetical protein